MVKIRSVNDIILNLIDFFKIVQPNLDLKPGTVSRDLFVDATSNQLALLYDEMSKVSNQQSLRLVVGSDLDKLARNFGLSRKQPTFSTGVALLTFNSLSSTININKGDLLTASNGFSFSITSGVSVVPSQSNFYKSLATKYRNDLDFLGISDQFAVQVSVQATSAGSSGDISKYSLSKTTIPGISNVTNVNLFIGGNDQEDDAAFRNRILSVFSGSSVGTSLGYKNVALATSGVADAFVVEPGSPLMTRDGSEVAKDETGSLVVTSEGTGGKVDVVILGSNLVQSTDSYIYRDLSNNNDPTNAKNIVVLGQITGDANKTFNQKRISEIAAGTLPAQPVSDILQVSGSSSGSNFKPKSVDTLGRVTGNYELIKDTGVYGGSPWGFDSFHWISNSVAFNEDRIKGKFCGQDQVTFSDVIEIPQIKQNISIVNENSTVLNTDRTLVQLLHTPATAVTRVFNVNTGERYTVTNQNPNGTGAVNTSGIIKISGSTLPTQSDVLQVDYNWQITYDQFADYDGRLSTTNPRPVTDSVDWGYSNLVRSEKIEFTNNATNTFFSGSASLPISSVLSASIFSEIDGYVATVTSGTFTGRLSIVLDKLISETTSVDSIYWKNTDVELYNTAQADGSFSNAAVVVGITTQFKTTIILPQDSKAIVGDKAVVILNKTDLFNNIGSTGNYSGSSITIPSANFDTTAEVLTLDVSYIANVQNLISTGITSLPISRSANGFSLNSNNGFNNNYVSNIVSRENQTVQKNLSNEFYVELNVSSLDSTISEVVSVIRLSDGLQLWNDDNAGTISTNSSTNNYQLIFSGYNSPAIGDRTLVIYNKVDSQRSQPFTFSNKIFEKYFDTIQYNPSTDLFSVSLPKFVTENTVSFEIIEPNTDIVLASATDGYLTANVSGLNGSFYSASVNFNTIVDADSNVINIIYKKIKLKNCTTVNNNNTYDIISYNSNTNEIIIGNNISNVENNQVSIVRVSDGKELWSNSGIINLTDGILEFPATSSANASDLTYISMYVSSNLKQSPTRLAINVSDQIVNTGIITVMGTTVIKATDIVFSATSSLNILKQNLRAAVRLALGLNSNATIPSNVSLVKIAKLERVTTTNSTSDEILLVKSSYDLEGTTIGDNTLFSNEFLEDKSLDSFDFILPSTSNNISNIDSQIVSGDKFRVTFYYATTSDQENVEFTRNGTLYTNKSFAMINKVYISSGFGSSRSAKIIISSFNQPLTGSRYTTYYNYIGPKQNERIIIKYNNNKLVLDTTFNIEKNRPINADVLVREAKEILIDVTMNVVIIPQYATSAPLVLQNLKDKLIATINSGSLGTYIDSSSLINAAFSVNGIGGARIQYFNVNGTFGNTLSLQAENDEYFSANLITVNQVAN